MLDQIFLICNQILLYLRINYISPRVLFSADWMLIQLDKEKHLLDLKCVR